MKHLIVIIFILQTIVSYGQSRFLSDKEMDLKVGFYGSLNSKLPYLNKVNQYGVVPDKAQTLFVNAALRHNTDSTNEGEGGSRAWGFGYGAEVQVNVGGANQILLPELYASGRFKGIELYLGRRREFFGLADTTGTWGSYLWSGNALPIPKVQLSTPRYIPLIGQGFLSTKFGISHGFFGNQNFTENYYLHQKWLYFKIGRESSQFNFIGGINQSVQWGGYSETLKDDPYASVNGHFASDGFAFLNVVLPFKFWKRPNNKYSPYEMQYRFGNHLGSVDLGLRYRTENYTVHLARQTPWEDGQAPEVFFSWDGNYSLTVDLPKGGKIHRVSLELLNTRRQGKEVSKLAKALGLTEKHPEEYQNYLNHGQYLEGWSYEGRGIGSPAIIPKSDLVASQSERIRFTEDNAVIAPAVALSGKAGKVNVKVNCGMVFSTGWLGGLRSEQLVQSFSRISGTFPLPGRPWVGRVELGIDNGKIYGNNTGVNITLLRNWSK